MRISDWSSDVCSSDLKRRWALRSDDDGLIFSTSGSPRNIERPRKAAQRFTQWRFGNVEADYGLGQRLARRRSEEHTSELQSLMRISYAVFCLKKKTT